MQIEPNPRKNFVHCYLPWIIGGLALLIFLGTLNRGITLYNLNVVSQVTGWNWRPIFTDPVHFVLTCPIRLLPAALQPAALNILSAICAALTLALLARSVAILPHDRTRDERHRVNNEFSFLSTRTAWIPPVLAALVCGLQLTFWENAVNDTGEALDLLLFAYVVRCLLEYRIEYRESWLTRLAFVYGLGATNNWAMIGYFPAFLAALIWIKGRTFFDFRFFTRMVLCGLAGLSLYLLLPILISSEYGTSFWEALRANLGAQKYILFNAPRYVLLLVGFTSLLPVLVIGIRWPSHLGDTSAAGSLVGNLMFHVIYGVLLAACIYVAFDPPFSPRNLGGSIPFLTLYYLGALSIGYLSGYFLLVFGRDAGRSWDRPSPARRAFGSLMTWAITGAVIAAPAALIYKNVSRIRDNNSPELMHYGLRLAESLPEQGAIVLSDDSDRLYAVAAALDQRQSRDKFLLLETSTLSYTIYHRYLHQRFGVRVPPNNFHQSTNELIDSLSLMVYFAQAAQTRPVYYLHPSFGYYFEMTYAKPRGLAYQLIAYPTNAIAQPSLTAAEIQQTEAAWDKVRDDLQAISLSAKRDPKNPYWHLNAAWVGTYYSRALNAWGVELQRHDQWDQAALRFDQALAVSPENPVASVNQEYNRQFRKGKRGPIQLDETMTAKFEVYRRNLRTVLTSNGPFDEPAFNLEVGQVFLAGRLHRQAAQQFLRVQKLTPENFQANLFLADLFVQTRLSREALELVRSLRAQNHPSLQNPTNQIALIAVEAAAYLATNNAAAAAKILEQAERTYPKNAELLGMIANVYASFGDYTNALAATEKQLAVAPDHPLALLNLSAHCIELKDFDRAIRALGRLIALQPENPLPVHNRAIAHLHKGDWDAAEKDYETLERLLPPTHSVYYGLGEIAYRKNQVAAAIKHYTAYMKYAPPGTQEAQLVADRLRELKRNPKKFRRSA